MLEKNIFKRKFLELSGSYFHYCDDIIKIDDVINYASNTKIDYLLINSTKQFSNLQSLNNLVILNVNTDEQKIYFQSFNNESHFLNNNQKLATGIHNKEKNNHYFLINHKSNYKRFRIFNKTYYLNNYNKFLRRFRTNILIPNSNSNDHFNARTINNAITNGNSYIVDYIHGVPYNFYVAVVNDNGQSAIFGERINIENKDLFMYFNLPSVSDIHLFHNNKYKEKKHDKQGYFKITEKGFYNLLINRYTINWIYTNPIYVT